MTIPIQAKIGAESIEDMMYGLIGDRNFSSSDGHEMKYLRPPSPKWVNKIIRRAGQCFSDCQYESGWNG